MRSTNTDMYILRDKTAGKGEKMERKTRKRRLWLQKRKFKTEIFLDIQKKTRERELKKMFIGKLFSFIKLHSCVFLAGVFFFSQCCGLTSRNFPSIIVIAENFSEFIYFEREILRFLYEKKNWKNDFPRTCFIILRHSEHTTATFGRLLVRHFTINVHLFRTSV